MTKIDNDKTLNRLLEIGEYIKNKRNEVLSIEEIQTFLNFAMNMGEFQIYILEKKYKENINLSETDMLEEFLNQTSNEEILTLYDILQNTDEKNIEYIINSYSNKPKTKKL